MSESSSLEIVEWPRLINANQTLPYGLIREQAADFIVDEVSEISHTGDGEHLWMKVKKTSKTTPEVAALLAKAFSVKSRDVTFAGLKDKHAVATQWFSIHLPGKPDRDEILPDDNIEVLDRVRHNKKIRIGVLKGNRFGITIRDIDGDSDDIENGIQLIRKTGAPNYFGEQRFGYQQRNLSKVLRYFDRQYRPNGRQEKSLLISSARSLLFNEVVAARIRDESWDKVLRGDVLNLSGSHSVFLANDELPVLQDRFDRADVHLTGPLYGDGKQLVSGRAEEIEATVLDAYPEFTKGLNSIGAKAARRAMRLVPKDLNYQWLDKKTLLLEFSLPAGAYATSVLRELFDYSVASNIT